MTMGAVSDKEKGLPIRTVPSSPGMSKFTWNLNSAPTLAFYQGQSVSWRRDEFRLLHQTEFC